MAGGVTKETSHRDYLFHIPKVSETLTRSKERLRLNKASKRHVALRLPVWDTRRRLDATINEDCKVARRDAARDYWDWRDAGRTCEAAADTLQLRPRSDCRRVTAWWRKQPVEVWVDTCEEKRSTKDWLLDTCEDKRRDKIREVLQIHCLTLGPNN